MKLKLVAMMTYKLVSPAIRLIFICLIVGSVVRPAIAQISPGELSAQHQALEGLSNCTKCHQLGATIADKKCLECHKAVAARIANRRGYHVSTEVANRNCSSCHREHNGREYDLVYWPQGQKAFDHKLTGYSLEGAHQKQECRTCHKTTFIRAGAFLANETIQPERTFLGLNHDCLNCHADEHLTQLTDRCLDCHTYQAWAPADHFNHDLARYKLTGKHKETGCPKCHPNQSRPTPLPTGLIAKKGEQGIYIIYDGLSFGNCLDCHKDVHQGRLGTNCTNCHTTESFRFGVTNQKFDHNHTNYPLLGKHTKVACNRCHTSGNMTKPLAFGKCRDCHRDAHLNRFAQQPDSGACEACHTVKSFSPSSYSVEAHQQSHYPLTGSHLAIPCNQCHVPIARTDGGQIANFELKYKDCADCHKDVHQGQVNLWIERGGCAYCHQTETWHRTFFDHALASFTLDGKHREILCLKCHYLQADGGGKQVWMKPLAKNCAGCHEDLHRGQFLKEGQETVACESCHRSSGWSDLLFVHNKDSRFVLDGAHEKLACRACHKPVSISNHLTVLYKPLGTHCVDCHQRIEKAVNEDVLKIQPSGVKP